jgi:hypothetical protein
MSAELAEIKVQTDYAVMDKIVNHLNPNPGVACSSEDRGTCPR